MNEFLKTPFASFKLTGRLVNSVGYRCADACPAWGGGVSVVGGGKESPKP